MQLANGRNRDEGKRKDDEKAKRTGKTGSRTKGHTVVSVYSMSEARCVEKGNALVTQPGESNIEDVRRRSATARFRISCETGGYCRRCITGAVCPQPAYVISAISIARYLFYRRPSAHLLHVETASSVYPRISVVKKEKKKIERARARETIVPRPLPFTSKRQEEYFNATVYRKR